MLRGAESITRLSCNVKDSEQDIYTLTEHIGHWLHNYLNSWAARTETTWCYQRPPGLDMWPLLAAPSVMSSARPASAYTSAENTNNWM